MLANFQGKNDWIEPCCHFAVELIWQSATPLAQNEFEIRLLDIAMSPFADMLAIWFFLFLSFLSSTQLKPSELIYGGIAAYILHISSFQLEIYMHTVTMKYNTTFSGGMHYLYIWWVRILGFWKAYIYIYI